MRGLQTNGVTFIHFVCGPTGPSGSQNIIHPVHPLATPLICWPTSTHSFHSHAIIESIHSKLSFRRTIYFSDIFKVYLFLLHSESPFLGKTLISLDFSKCTGFPIISPVYVTTLTTDVSRQMRTSSEILLTVISTLKSLAPTIMSSGVEISKTMV